MFYDKEVYHFLFLHFPIGLLVTGYMFNVFKIILKDEKFDDFISWIMGVGIIFGIFSIITGFITDWDIGYMENPFPVFSTHGSLMILCISLYCILFYLKFKKINDKIFLLLHTVATVLLMYGAHLGAKWADRI